MSQPLPLSSFTDSTHSLPLPSTETMTRTSLPTLASLTISEDISPSSGNGGGRFATPPSTTAMISPPTVDSVSFPLIYPALLSQVAYLFKARVPTGTLIKDSLEYKDAFTGREAVDTLAWIIRTSDRNLALLLGRALDAQHFFHDVTYTHRLRDNPNELYQFSDLLPMRFSENSEQIQGNTEEGWPNGVFTLLTDCYSPTCTRDRLCYSIACPRRLEQQTRLNQTAASMVKRSVSHASNLEAMDDFYKHDMFWSTSVSKEVLDSVSEAELKRQEAIFEIVQKEKEYVDDLEMVQRLFIQPLRTNGLIEDSRADKFIRDVFINIPLLYQINLRLSRRLISRQNERAVVEKIGDIFAGMAPEFYPYVEYGAKQVYARHFLALEKVHNAGFEQFLEDCERRPETRKLPLESFLARPTTHMGRYPLLLEAILKRTPPGHPDQIAIPQAITIIKDVLSKINVEAGKADNLLKLNQLNQHLVFREGEWQDLHLTDEGRQILRQGNLISRKTTGDVDLTVFLFDHMVLLTKQKKPDFYKVYKRPIPLELIVIANDKAVPQRTVTSPSTPIAPRVPEKTTTSTKILNQVSNSEPTKYPIFLTHLGRHGGLYTLYAASQADRKAWIDTLEDAKAELIAKKTRFELKPLVEGYFPASIRVNCSAKFGNKILIGAENGLHVGETAGPFLRVLALDKLMQIDVLPEYDLLLCLSDRTLLTFPLEVLSTPPQEAVNAAKKGKKLSSHVSFFKAGICAGKSLVCAVKSTSLTTTIKAFEPIASVPGATKRINFIKLIRGASESLKLYKEFYIPTESSSIHFLKTKLCVGCTKGFEIVDLESLNTQGLLDPQDESLEFVMKRENLRPIAIFRMVDATFLLCYDEFAFYVDRFGRRTRHDQLIQWTGSPTSFAFQQPYIIAFDSTMVEIRNVETCELQQVMVVSNLRSLNTDPDLLHCVIESTPDQLQIVALSRVE